MTISCAVRDSIAYTVGANILPSQGTIMVNLWDVTHLSSAGNTYGQTVGAGHWPARPVGVNDDGDFVILCFCEN